MATAKRNVKTGSYDFYKVAWTGTAADYNALEQGPGGEAGCETGLCSRAILVTGLASGVLKVKDPEGNTVEIPAAVFTAKPELKIQVSQLIASGSGNCTVVVFW
jgi:hypothetical protein